MSYLDQLEAMDFENTLPQTTAKTVLTTYDSKGSDQGRQFSKSQLAHEAAQHFYNHLFGPAKATGCCYAPRGRYCPVGSKLRKEYHEACADRGHPHGR